MTKPDWIITTSGERPIAQVSAEASKAGFEVGEVLEEIGIITGRGAAAAVRKLRGRPGIADISPAAPVDIGPPGGDKTW